MISAQTKSATNREIIIVYHDDGVFPCCFIGYRQQGAPSTPASIATLNRCSKLTAFQLSLLIRTPNLLAICVATFMNSPRMPRNVTQVGTRSPCSLFALNSGIQVCNIYVLHLDRWGVSMRSIWVTVCWVLRFWKNPLPKSLPKTTTSSICSWRSWLLVRFGGLSSSDELTPPELHCALLYTKAIVRFPHLLRLSYYWTCASRTGCRN